MMSIMKIPKMSRPLLDSISIKWKQWTPYWLPKHVYSTSKGIETVEDVAAFMKTESSQNIVVMVGAGVSTPSGIPDFRSPGTGLYDNLQKYQLPYPEAIFDIEYFHLRPEPFYRLAQELYPSGKYRPNHTHYFIRLLHDKHLLLRLYTQNIDGLERLAGIPGDKLVEAHGTFHTARCTVCYRDYLGEEIKQEILDGKIPKCRSEVCKGVIKPDIVFFGEQLSSKFYSFLKDMPRADLLLIMGTSLEVQPFAGIAEAVLPGTPRVLFNREAAGSFRHKSRKNDVFNQGDLVQNIMYLAKLLGWSEELEALVNSDARGS